MEASKRQKEIYNYILSEIAAKGFPPSVREICEAIGLSSTSTVHSHLIALEKLGYIKRDPAKPRTIEVLKERVSQELSNSTRARVVPVVGRAAAGTPIFAEENVEEVLVLPRDFAMDDSFVIEVKGDSMIDAAILNGDYLVARKQDSASDGDIVVAIIDGEATIKRFFKRSNHIELRPENSLMEPILTKDAKIIGKVTSLLRRI